MKKIYFLLALALCSGSLSAQQKLTAPVMQRAYEAIEAAKLHGTIGTDLNSTNAAASEASSSETVSVFITLSNGHSVDELREVDFLTVVDELSTCIIAKLPAVRLMDLEDVDCISCVELCQKLNVDMNYARPSGSVDNVHSGFSHGGSTMSFDGAGVIVGMMDVGLEANHINFKKDNGSGESRIQRLWWLHSNDGSYKMYTPTDISSFSTDDNNESHATHVAGIMGGSYSGNGDYAYMSTATGTAPEMRTKQPIPYYGVATGADLALSVGALYTSNILQGVKNIFDYADSVGKPAVVNLSLGHTAGPHDGTDAYSTELARQGKRGIICMSAGNDGDANISIVKSITAESGDNSCLRTFIQGNSNNVITGIADLWGTDNTVLNLQWGVYSVSAKTFTPVITINKARQTASTAGVAAFTAYFTGSITATSAIDPRNNRFEVYTDFSGVSSASADKVIALYVTGANTGQKLYLYSSTANLTFSDKPGSTAGTVVGYTNGSPSNSINDGACADNIIAVGAYVSRTTCGALTTNSYWPAVTGFSVGSIAPFSSYGTTFSGETLPHVCAPGARIVSSYSSYYVTNKNNSGDMVGKATTGRFNITTYYWGTMNGTSMSCPFVTGTIGLWLQADPTLTYDRVMDVINSTSTYESFSMGRNKARWGAGKIDALKGIQYVLDNRAAIGDVWADADERLIVTATADGYEVYMAGAADITATLYDLQGRPVASARGTDGTATVSASSLQSGIYILRASTPTASLSRKVTKN